MTDIDAGKRIYLRIEEAAQLVKEEPDPATRRLLRRLLGAHLEHHVRQDLVPCCPVDMFYVVKLARTIFQDHEMLRAILDGLPAGEWFEEDDY